MIKKPQPTHSLSLAVLVLSGLALQAQVTTYNGTSPGNDSWNTGSNWSSGVPTGSMDALISTGVVASANNSGTQSYSGTLTLEANSEVQIQGTGGSETALVAPSAIVLRSGSELQWNLNANLTFPPITLEGPATLRTPFGASDWQTDNFAAIEGPHTLTTNGFNGHRFNFTSANTFGELVCDASDRYEVHAQAAGSLGTGNVTVNKRAADDRSAILVIDAADALDDTATLTLNGKGWNGSGGGPWGGTSHVLVMNADDTVAKLIVDGVEQPPGTYIGGSASWIGGSGTLTVEPVSPLNPAPAFGEIVPAGTVNLTWTNMPPNTGTDVWVDVYFGTDPGSLSPVASGVLNLTTWAVSAPVADDYYWRVDSYLDGVSTGTPLAGTLLDFEVNDTDGDGFTDAYELANTDPPSNTDLDPADDLEPDGLTNQQEFDLGTDPNDPDTDGDGLNDGPELAGVDDRPATDPNDADSDDDGLDDGDESNTGVWVSSTNSGTNPQVFDTDEDGLRDGAESNTNTFVDEDDTGTDPLDPDSDADGTGDWYEVAVSLTDPNSAAEKTNTPYPLPDPDGSTGDPSQPVKVYIMSGQSNMVGFGKVSGAGDGTLSTMTVGQNKFPDLIDEFDAWTTRQDVRYRGVISDFADAQLSPGALGSNFGPELGFGYVMGWHHDEPVLLIKSCTGNRSLGWDCLPPGSTSYVYNGTNFAGYGGWGNWPVGAPEPTTGTWYAGKEFDRFFMDEADWAHAEPSDFNVVDILDNFGTEYPSWASQGFEIAGFVWWQGDKDRYDLGYATRYEPNLVNLIDSLRDYYEDRYPGQVVANAPFVLATLGQTPLNSSNTAEKAILDAQLAVDGETGNYPQYAGNVKTVYSHPLSQGGSSNGHYNGHAGTYLLVGDALGRAMVELQGNLSDYDAWASQYATTGIDLSDPDADLTGNGWTNNEARLFGLNPTSGASVSPISVPLDAGSGTFSYTRRDADLTGATYEIWTSTTLEPGSWVKDGGAGQVEGTPDVNNVETVVVTLTATPVGGSLYAQVRVVE